MKRLIWIGFLCVLAVTTVQGQELNATVTVNSERIQTTDKQVFEALEGSITQLINTNKWSSATFASNERIDCTFAFTILEQPSETTFKLELFVQARRPVFNSTYITSLISWRDTNIEIEYMENSRLEWNELGVESNLEAVLGFYCYLILGLDFESFSPQGGRYFFQNAQTIANQAQSQNWSGWAAFDDNKSRGAMVNLFIDESLKSYRDLWYTYHRKGLDEMAANADRGRTTILNALPALKELRSVRDSDILIQMFGDCKLDEIVSIASKATAEEKKSTYDLLRNLYPTKSGQLESLTK